jgi:glucoamylase
LRSGGEIATTDDNARFRERLTGESPTKAAFERGERFMRTVRAYTPPTGDLSEQFDHTTGAQTSAKRLAWSYAAFITAAASRRQAGQAIRD